MKYKIYFIKDDESLISLYRYAICEKIKLLILKQKAFINFFKNELFIIINKYNEII